MSYATTNSSGAQCQSPPAGYAADPGIFQDPNRANEAAEYQQTGCYDHARSTGLAGHKSDAPSGTCYR